VADLGGRGRQLGGSAAGEPGAGSCGAVAVGEPLEGPLVASPARDLTAPALQRHPDLLAPVADRHRAELLRALHRAELLRALPTPTPQREEGS
jgi:hypothetical protein